MVNKGSSASKSTPQLLDSATDEAARNAKLSIIKDLPINLVRKSEVTQM